MGNTCGTRARNEGLTQRLDSFRLVGFEQPEWHVLRMCFARGQEYPDTADGKRKYASGRALKEVAALYCFHGSLPRRHRVEGRRSLTSLPRVVARRAMRL